MTGLLHQEPAPLLPVSLQQLLQGLWLPAGVKHAGHSVCLPLKPTNCLRSATPSWQGNSGQLRNQLGCVR